APGEEPTAAAAAADRDADLTGHDRVQLLLDVDRDYSTYFRLEVDQRGQIADDCWGDRTWNAKWFVARGETSTHWTAEAAIAWSSLTAERPRPKQAWAMNVQRIAPRQAFASWSQPAAAQP